MVLRPAGAWRAEGISYNEKHPDAKPAGRFPVRPVRTARAKVAELVDALDLESSGETRESSSLSFRTSSPCVSPKWTLGSGLEASELRN